MVLREDAAKQIFGNEDPIGKTIKASVGSNMQDLVVSAVIKEGAATSLNFRAFARIENLNDYTTGNKDWTAAGGPRSIWS